MLSTRFVPGSPNWIDLGTPDVDAAATFYGGVFGWTHQSAGPEAGGYGMFHHDGKMVAGIGPLQQDQGPTAWNVYFQTPDANATADAVRAGGGTVLAEPMDVFDLGRMAVFTDPAGASFAIWQPGKHKGLEAASEGDTLCWTELNTPDPAAGTAFYTKVFGWQTTSMPMPGGGGDYTMIHPAGGTPDDMFGGIAAHSGNAHWLLYFDVANCDATVAKSRDLGGAVTTAPVDLEGVGRIAVVSDPAGATFALLTPAEQG